MEQDLIDIGLNKNQRQFLYKSVLKFPRNFVLVVAPPHEDVHKTSILLLKELSSLHPRKKIIALEKFKRCDLESVSQFELQQDKSYIDYFDIIVSRRPDIVYIDDVPDRKVIDKIFESTHFFSLVISTFHASSACDAIAKFAAMGISKRQLAERLDFIISQRLLRKLCAGCVKVFDPLEEEILDLEKHIKKLGWNRDINLCRGSGKDPKGNICGICQGTGYNGTTAIFEIFKFSTKLRSLVDGGANSDDLETQAQKENIQLLWYSGLEKALNQETSLEELVTVLGYPMRLHNPGDQDFDD